MSFAAITSGAWAEGADRIEVLGTRITHPAPSEAAGVTQIPREDVEVSGFGGLVPLLGRQPGVSIAQPGGPGGPVELFLRGAESNFTQVLIDGLRVNDPTDARGGAFDFSELALGEVESVDIIRGPRSSIYGSDALAGIVSIETRSPGDTLSGSGSFHADQEGGYRTALTLRGPVTQSVRASITGTHEDVGDLAPASELTRSTLSGRVEADLPGGGSLDLSARYADQTRRRFPTDSGGFGLAVLRDLETATSERLQLGARWRQPITQSITSHLNIGWSDTQTLLDSPAIAPGVLDGVPATMRDNDFERLEATWYVEADVSPRLTVLAGVDVVEEDAISNATIDFGFPVPANFEATRTQLGAFAEAQFQATENVTLHGSLRVDDPENDDTQVNGRISMSARLPGPDLRLEAGFATGYKLPSLFAIGDPLVGNPGLEAETSQSFDAGVAKPFWGGKAEASLSAFWTKYENLIDFNPLTFSLVNVDKVRAVGAELVLTAQPTEQLGLFAQVSHVDLEVVEGSGALLNRPEWRASARADYQATEKLSVYAEGRFVGEQQSSSVPTGQVTLDAYATLDLGGAYQITENMRFEASLTNAFNADTETQIGFEEPGRVARFGLRIGF